MRRDPARPAHPAHPALWGAALLGLLLSALLAWQAVQAQPAVPTAQPLGEREAMRVLGPAEVSMLLDPTGALGIEQVSAPEMAARFKPLSKGLHLNYSDDVVWIRVQLQRQATAPALWRLELTSTLLNDVRLYPPAQDGPLPTQQAGDRFAFAERQVSFRRPVFELGLPDVRPRVFHLRLASDSTMTSAFILRQQTASQASMQTDSLWVGGLLGMVLLSTFFFLQAWFVTRDRLLALSAAATAAFGLSAAANLGLLSQHLLPQRPMLADGLHPFTMALYFWLLCWLFGEALDLRRLSPRLQRLQWAAPTLCLVASLSRFADLYASLGGSLMMCGMLFGLGWSTAGAWSVWRKTGSGLFTAVALTVFTTTFSVAPIIALGLLPPTSRWEVFWVIGSVGFILMSQSMVLVRVRQLRSRRREAERAAHLAEAKVNQEMAWRRQQASYFARVADDLRTTLGAVRIDLANLERSLGGAAAASRERMHRMQASAQRASDMIERHLQLQRLEQPDVELLLLPASISECVEQVRASVVEVWPRHEFRAWLDDGAPAQAVIDAELSIRAVINLAANAAKAAPEGSVVEIAARGDGQGGVRFEVRDRGPGLEGVALDGLLEMHWRRVSADLHGGSHGGGGFGIGLPVVARIAALHQGRVEYRRGGSTTVFSLWLPKPPQDAYASPGAGTRGQMETAAA